MDPHHEQCCDGTRAAVDACFDQFRFARAADLARSGRYLEAQGLLSTNGHHSDAPRDLDLLARIAVHQGRISDARRLWEAALQKDPQNPDYNECLQRLGDLPRIRLSFDTVIECLVWTAIAFGIAILLYVLLSRK
jgi:tetratricopeptide (TPR) repeat protein